MLGFLVIHRKGSSGDLDVSSINQPYHKIESGRTTALIFGTEKQVRTFESHGIIYGIEGSMFLDDTQLVEAYRHGLEPLFEKIRGWFNLFIIDSIKNRVVFAHDHLGIKPLYWLDNDDYCIVSSSLAWFPKILSNPPSINYTALVEFLIFNHPLGENTFFQDVHLLDPGHYLELESDKLSKHCYFDPDTLFTDHPVSGRKALDMIEKSFKQAVARAKPDHDRTALSLTGGFDGRTVLSVIEDTRNLLLYTFGTPEVTDMMVASEIASQMGMTHRRFIIDSSYHETKFEQAAKDIILRSDGLATYERAHYMMAFQDIGKEVDVVLSGNCGSELFRAIHITGCIVSPLMAKLLQADDFRPEFSKYIDTMTDTIPLLNPPVDLKDRLLESFEKYIWQPLKRYSHSKRFYLLQMTESFRKYFGTEMKADSHYAENRSAYIDIDLIRTINQTVYSSAYQRVFASNPFLRKKGQIPYAYIIKKNSPILSDIKTGRGYAPKTVLTPIGLMTIVAPYIRRHLRKPENTFDSKGNALRFFELYLQQCRNPYLDFNKTQEAISSGEWQTQQRLFAKISSWGFWYNQAL